MFRRCIILYLLKWSSLLAWLASFRCCYVVSESLTGGYLSDKFPVLNLLEMAFKLFGIIPLGNSK
jgi:hypothetical protein